MGSHALYESRYPEGWNKFDASDISRGDLGNAERLVIAQYMNSVYYNDYIVSQIIEHYAHTPTMVVYFSDHGEVLYNDPDNPTYASHAFIPTGVEIPFLVYMSPSLQQMAPNLYERIKASVDYPIMMDTFADALLGILGVKSKYTQPSANFWSEDYDLHRERIIHDVTPGRTLLYKPSR